MQKSKFIFLFLVIIIIPKLVLADTATTSTSTLISTTPSPTPTGVTAPQVPQIIQAINLAKAQLDPVVLNHQLIPIYKKKTKKIISYQLADKDIALAILDPSTNNILVTIGRQNDKKMVFPDPAVDVTLTRFNGVNSKFQVNRPTGGIVVALKYLISPNDKGSKNSIENALSQAIYVPASAALNQPDVIAYGAKYLDNLMAQVTEDLYGLPSQAIPGKTITEAIPPAMIKSLIYAEHTDSYQIFNGHTKDAIDQLNILFATNQGDTYKYSVSSAGARGISQFLPSTYASLATRHPEANLNLDPIVALADHRNSIKAMYLLLDDYAGAVRVRATQGFASSRVFDYGAASYNGGTTRVFRAVNAFGDNWNLDQNTQAGTIQAQISGLNGHIKNLKAELAKTKDKTKKTELNSELANAQGQLNDAKNQLSSIKKLSLKNETINYLKKIYAVVPYFNDQMTTASIN